MSTPKNPSKRWFFFAISCAFLCRSPPNLAGFYISYRSSSTLNGEAPTYSPQVLTLWPHIFNVSAQNERWKWAPLKTHTKCAFLGISCAFLCGPPPNLAGFYIFYRSPSTPNGEVLTHTPHPLHAFKILAQSLWDSACMSTFMLSLSRANQESVLFSLQGKTFFFIQKS